MKYGDPELMCGRGGSWGFRQEEDWPETGGNANSKDIFDALVRDSRSLNATFVAELACTRAAAVRRHPRHRSI